MDPDLPIAHYNRGLSLLRLGRDGEAMESFHRTQRLVPGLPFVRASLAVAHAQHGREDEARDLLAGLVAEDSVDNPVRTYIAHVQEALGMKDEALRSLREAVDRREPLGLYISLAWLPFHSLQSEPEFQVLLGEINGIVGRSARGET
jgi:predicted Zn-dependent protease